MKFLSIKYEETAFLNFIIIFSYLNLLTQLYVQGHPIEWVSGHRYHHAQCDKEADPHSPYDGFFWSHMGWLFDSKVNIHLVDMSNAGDLRKDPFYKWVKNNYL